MRFLHTEMVTNTRKILLRGEDLVGFLTFVEFNGLPLSGSVSVNENVDFSAALPSI